MRNEGGLWKILNAVKGQGSFSPCLFLSLMSPDHLQDPFSLCICSVFLYERQNVLDNEGDFIQDIAIRRTLVTARHLKEEGENWDFMKQGSNRGRLEVGLTSEICKGRLILYVQQFILTQKHSKRVRGFFPCSLGLVFAGNFVLLADEHT